MHILPHTLPLNSCGIALNINYQRSKLNIGGKYNQRYGTAVHICKNIRLRVKTRVKQSC